MTFAECAKIVEARLSAINGLEMPDAHAWLLVAAAAGLTTDEAAVSPARVLSGHEESFVQTYLELKSPVPVPLYLGYCDFAGLRLRVSPDTLLPGTETSLLIERAVSFAESLQAETIVEVGTGCGMVAIALALRLRECTVYATEISGAALTIARENVRACHMERRVMLSQGSWCESLRPFALDGKVDLMVSNPPYCSQAAISSLPPAFLDFAPASAIDGGPDGLRGHRAVIAEARTILRDGGGLLLQTDIGQADNVVQEVEQCVGFGPARVGNGSQDQPRFVSVVKAVSSA